jgi:hypothetical protein
MVSTWMWTEQGCRHGHGVDMDVDGTGLSRRRGAVENDVDPKLGGHRRLSRPPRSGVIFRDLPRHRALVVGAGLPNAQAGEERESAFRSSQPCGLAPGADREEPSFFAGTKLVG